MGKKYITKDYLTRQFEHYDETVVDGKFGKLGTASAKDIAESGDASESEIVMGNDSRLTDARNAADVPEWAKAETKPAYTASEVGAIPTTAINTPNGVAGLDATGKIPAAQVSGASSTSTKTTKLKPILEPYWVIKTWSGVNPNGNQIWSDGENIYYSDGEGGNYVLNKSNNTWTTKSWNGTSSLDGKNIWTDGQNIYNSKSYRTNQFVLDRSTDTWTTKAWRENNWNAQGSFIWTDGENIYGFRSGSTETFSCVLEKATSGGLDAWNDKIWNGFSKIIDVWTDGQNIYSSYDDNQYVLDKSTDTWNQKTWNGLTSFRGEYIWTDGNNIYYSSGNNQYILDKSTSTWSAKTWSGLTSFDGRYIWVDGEDVYYSNGNNQYVLVKPKSI